MSMLRDYRCKYCNKVVEQFDDDEALEICPNCGMDGLVPTISALNIKTSCKSGHDVIFEPVSGLAIWVKENGDIGEKTRFNCGDVIDVTGGDKVIITPHQNPDPEKLKIIARKITETETPPKDQLH